MTNGEKFCIDFPNIRIEVFVSYVQVVGENYEFNNLYPLTWWNAEYKEPTTNNLGVDWDELKRKILMDIDGSTDDAWLAYGEVRNIIINSINEYVQNIKDLPSVTPQEPTEKCTWIKYDYRTMCPKEHDADNPYWRIPENRMEALKYCPYCGKEIEVEK